MRRRVKQTVLRVLRHDPAAREDDNKLIIEFCREMGCEILPEQINAFAQLPSFGSIVRARAKIQEQGRFLPSPDVARERRRYRRNRQDQEGEKQN